MNSDLLPHQLYTQTTNYTAVSVNTVPASKTACIILESRLRFIPKIVSEYDQEIPQSQTADNPGASRGRARLRENDSFSHFRVTGWQRTTTVSVCLCRDFALLQTCLFKIVSIDIIRIFCCWLISYYCLLISRR